MAKTISVAAGPSVTIRTSDFVFFEFFLSAAKENPQTRVKMINSEKIFLSAFIIKYYSRIFYLLQ